jgi:DNA end-binding protein Ku
MATGDVATGDLRGRSFWSGTITFGLVSVPVDLFPANRSAGVSLRMLSPEGTPLARRYVNPETGKPVDPEEIVRGYEIEDGKYVVISDEELESLEPRKSRDIDLRLFVPVDDLDPIYFERAYFLTPAGESTKAYRLLAATMERTGRAGIATFVMRGKEYLIAILSGHGVLRAETLRFHDEIRAIDEVEVPDASRVKKADVARMRKAITGNAASRLAVSELEDDYSDRLLKLVEKKRKKGRDVVESEVRTAEPDEDVIDLMEILKRSMKKADGARARTRTAAAPRRTAARTARAPARKPAAGSLTRAELYKRAQQLGIEGRSSMTKAELLRAVRAAD